MFTFEGYGGFNWCCLTRIGPTFANSADPDQLALEAANWFGSSLFATKYVNLYYQSGSSNLICGK